MAAVITAEIEDRLAADVAGEDQHGVGEVNRAPLAIGDAAVIEDLQHHVEDIGVGFLHLVKQDHRIGPAAYRFSELAAFFKAHIARRRADQTTDGVLLHVFAHVDAHHGVIAVEELVGEGLAQLGFAHTGGAKEQE